MDLNNSVSAKIDPDLLKTLASASASDIIRAILLLERKAAEEKPDPSRFSSREAYRKALIAAKRATNDEATLERLRLLSLNPVSGGLTQAIVVQGPALGLMQALQWPQVTHASLDTQLRVLRKGSSRNIRRRISNNDEFLRQM